MADYFIRIDDAREKRRTLLESSKASINILRGYQRLLAVRGQKMTLLKVFRKELQELTMLVNRMEELMPHFTEKELSELMESAPLPALGEKPKRKRKKAKTLPSLPGEGQQLHRNVYIGQPVQVPTLPTPAAPQPVVNSGEKLLDMTTLEAKLKAIEQRLSGL